MTPEKTQEVVAAFENVEPLIDPSNFNRLIDDVIKVFTGTEAILVEREDDDMPRTKGSKNKKSEVANGTQQQVSSVTIPQQDRDTMITEWKRASDEVKQWKEKEHALRQALVVQLFDGTKLEGAETIDLGYGGWQLRATKEQTYNASNKDGETDKLLDVLENRDRDLAEKLVRWQPEISKPTYRQTLELAQKYSDNEVLAALHAAITIKPGMPQLEMIPPKEDTPAPVVNAAPTFTLEENFIPED